MKRQAYGLIAILGLILVAATVSTHAQSSSTNTLKVSVPFAFTVGEKRLPAGDYTIKRVSENSYSYFIQGRDNNEVTAFLAAGQIRGRSDEAQTKLVFQGYAGQYFLSQVWMASSNIGTELPKTEAEREIAKSISAPETVAVLGTRR